MTGHVAFVAGAYAISALSLVLLSVWIIADGKARKRELELLEKQGIRRRSDRSKASS